MLAEEKIERWKNLRDEMFSSEAEAFLKARHALDAERRITAPQMTAYLKDYISGRVDTGEFRSTFAKKTRKEWRMFGLGGFSGAMFLNMLVNNLPDQEALTSQLKAVLPVPTNPAEGRQRLSRFMNYLDNLLQQRVVTRHKIQPAYAPFFVSAWWHVQNISEWPIYYVSAREALASEGLFVSKDQPVEDYFAFRDVFLALAHELNLSTWEMEHLCVWHDTPQIASVGIAEAEAVALVVDADLSPKMAAQEEKIHSHIQWLLARIGQKFGYKVWIAANDRKHTWNGEPLSKYSIDEMPRFNDVGTKSQRMIELIDVVWLKGKKIEAAFEVESTTSIFTGLLRMSDLALALDNSIFPLYIAVPEERTTDVIAQLSRLTFQRLGLHERCRFFAFENLIEQSEPIMRFASDVNAINEISKRVGEISEEES